MEEEEGEEGGLAVQSTMADGYYIERVRRQFVTNIQVITLTISVAADSGEPRSAGDRHDQDHPSKV